MENYYDLNKWASDALRSVITNPNNVETLDDQKTKYDGMTRKQKREADWKSQELTGETNEERYNRLKTTLSKPDIKDDSNIELDSSAAQRISEAVEDTYDFSQYNVTLDQIDNATKWATDAIRVIIYPTDSIEKLEDLYIKFKSQIRKHQRESDWKSVEVFGIDNETHYKYLKNKYSKKQIRPEEEETPRIKIIGADNADTLTTASITEAQCKFIKNLDIDKDQKLIMEGCLDLIAKKKTFYEDKIVSQLIDDTIELFHKNVTQVTDDTFIPYIDMPFYTPEEMYSLGIFNKDTNLFKVEASNKNISEIYDTKTWFEAYTLNYNGFYTKNMYYMNECRIERIKLLFNELCSIHNNDEARPIQQSILELGWNPAVKFTDENRAFAANRVSKKLREAHGNTSIIDTSFYNEASNKINNVDLAWKKALKPIYIVLVEGKRLFSDLTKKFTNSRFSHAAIGFDSKLTKLYSFNLDNGVSKKGGFSIESVEKYPHGNNLEVFTIFVKDKEYDQIMKFVDEYIDSQSNTSYSILNVFTLAFNVPFNNNMSMICSQFVDRLLKLVNINITNKDSALVNPGDFERASFSNKKIYKVYDDKVEKYDPKSVFTKIDRMIANVEPIKELFSLVEYSDALIHPYTLLSYITETLSFCRLDNLQQLDLYSIHITDKNASRFYNETVSHYIYAEPVCEIKEFPVQFSKDGDLLIKNYKKLNLNTEYNNSNKLLKMYFENGNIDGMKYELSKLQFLKDILDKKIYPNGEKDTSVDKKLVDLRALIMNTFNRYLKEVIKKDKSFNFTEYYNNSPFGDAIIKINSSTLKYSVEILKQLFR